MMPPIQDWSMRWGLSFCEIKTQRQFVFVLLPHDDPPHICLHLDGGAPGGGDQRQRGDAAQEVGGGRGGQDGSSAGAQVAQTGY